MTEKQQEEKQTSLVLEKYSGSLLPLLKKHIPVYENLVYVQPHHACMPEQYAKYHNQYTNFQCKESDVWVASFPKSGTTWCQELSWVAYHGLKHPDLGKLITARVPFFEWDCIFPEGMTMEHLPDDDLNKTGVMWDLLHTMGPPRFIKTHLHECLLPPNVAKVGSKIIYVCREPKDVVVSLFHHAKKLDGFTGTFDDMVDLFLADVYPWAPYWLHVLQYWAIRHRPNVLFLTFEQLKQDLSGGIKKVAQFLGVQRPGLPPGQISDGELEALKEHCSFGSMSKNQATNNEKLFASLSSVNGDQYEGVKFMRKGQVGDHKNYLSEDQIRRFQVWTDKWLTDSDFPYYRN